MARNCRDFAASRYILPDNRRLLSGRTDAERESSPDKSLSFSRVMRKPCSGGFNKVEQKHCCRPIEECYRYLVTYIFIRSFYCPVTCITTAKYTIRTVTISGLLQAHAKVTFKITN